MPDKRASDNGERVVLEELGDGGWRNKLFQCPAGPLQETVCNDDENHVTRMHCLGVKRKL